MKCKVLGCLILAGLIAFATTIMASAAFAGKAGMETTGTRPPPPPYASPTPTATSTAGYYPVKRRPSVTPSFSSLPGKCPGVRQNPIQHNTWAQIDLRAPRNILIHSDPGVKVKRIGWLKPGEVILVLDGPRCKDGYTWWLVQQPNGLKGWIAEGDAVMFWLIQPMDAFFYDTARPSTASKLVLKNGKSYFITLTGTFSLWVPQQWSDPGVCIRGQSKPRPMFPSIAKVNGQVGADPYYQFARPFYGPCQKVVDPKELISPMMISLDGGNHFNLPEPIEVKYQENHVYVYKVIGEGYPLIVKLDDVPIEDNYGQIFVTINEVQ